jgi:hypothetical protein
MEAILGQAGLRSVLRSIGLRASLRVMRKPP